MTGAARTCAVGAPEATGESAPSSHCRLRCSDCFWRSSFHLVAEEEAMAAVGVAAACRKASGPAPHPSRSGTSGTLTDPASSTVTVVVQSRGVARQCLDILRAASGEDSYGASFWRGPFGGFLPQPPYFSGDQRRDFWPCPAIGLVDGKDSRTNGRGKNKGGLYLPGLKRRGFTARLG